MERQTYHYGSGKSNKKKLKAQQQSIITFLSILYMVGAVGLSLKEPPELFLLLIPAIIILSVFFMLLTFRNWDIRFIYYLIFIFFAGFIIEIIGVKTKKVFGDYTYGTALGFKIFDVPPMMGLMWLMLICSAGFMVRTFKGNALTRAAIGATALVLLDMLIEPFAAKCNLWQWQNMSGLPENQNFIAWFVFSFLALLLFNLIRVKLRSNIGVFVFLINVAFFMVWTFLSR